MMYSIISGIAVLVAIGVGIRVLNIRQRRTANVLTFDGRIITKRKILISWPYASGKTSLLKAMFKEIEANGGRCVYISAEQYGPRPVQAHWYPGSNPYLKELGTIPDQTNRQCFRIDG